MKKNFETENIRLNHELTCLRLKNAKLEYFISKLNEKVDFYSNLEVKTEFDKGFDNAFKIMKNLFKGGMWYAWKDD